MELFSVSITAFRRFSSPANLRTNGKVVALVGPNEAGKSSVLDAIAGLGNANPFAANDVARGKADDQLRIIGRFLLDEEELETARLPNPTWLCVHKQLDGKQTYSFDPRHPSRNLDHRAPAITAAEALLADEDLLAAAAAAYPALGEQLKSYLVELREAPSDLDKPTLQTAREIGQSLIGLAEAHAEAGVATDLAKLWSDLVDLEAAPSPWERAIGAVLSRVPRILYFDEAARRLASDYSIDTLRQAVPPALAALFKVAKLHFADVLASIDSANSAALTTIEARANRALEIAFKEAWKQSGIRVALRFSFVLVEIQVVNDNVEFTPLAERSDGLRQFVALHAFAAQNHADRPILLIDEAEQRLHYDAQADLVQMLTRQQVASKVIYTTHSAGCLPEDLGQGVRLIEPAADGSAMSSVRNKFWSRPGGGFSPLLFGLGATTLAFFPTRHAVCVEGASDMLLYPKMFREALAKTELDYQIVPNLSSAVQSMAPMIPEAAAKIAFLVDGDDGGLAIRDGLLASGIEAGRIIVLGAGAGDAVEIEDFIEPSLLLRAANALIVRHYPGVPAIDRAAMPAAQRMAWLEQAYLVATTAKISKVDLAYEVLDLLDEDPRLPIVDPARREALSELASRVGEAVKSVLT